MAKKILIIDDDPEIVSYLKDIFHEAGYATVSAKDGVEGLEVAQVQAPDLITLDMEMPGRGGALFYVKLRQEPRLADIPVVIISGAPRVQSVGKDVPVLTKPIDPVKTLRVVKDMLKE